MFNSKIKTRVIFLFILLGFSVISNILTFYQDTVAISRFQEVKTSNLLTSPKKYEGKEISFGEQIKLIIFNYSTNDYILQTEKGLKLIILSIDILNVGVQAYFRGKSYLVSKGVIEVYDFHVRNNNSIILSFPGVVVFILLFFSVFKIDLKRLSFISRKEENA